MTEEELKNNIINYINENTKSFPFISKFWEIDIQKLDSLEPDILLFGHFETAAYNSSTFYKPFSKIINVSKI